MFSKAYCPDFVVTVLFDSVHPVTVKPSRDKDCQKGQGLQKYWQRVSMCQKAPKTWGSFQYFCSPCPFWQCSVRLIVQILLFLSFLTVFIPWWPYSQARDEHCQKGQELQNLGNKPYRTLSKRTRTTKILEKSLKFLVLFGTLRLFAYIFVVLVLFDNVQ